MPEKQLQGDRKLVYESPALQKVVSEVELFAKSDIPVLITGSSGAGKENVARLVHRASNRANQPFHALNCAAIPPSLIEDELFGHEKGAYTDARAQRKGAFENADGGTLFLDEIGEMPPALQTKLLRVLEDGHITRVGGSVPIPAKPRIVSATNRDIDTALTQGKIRQDLHYRLDGVRIHVPDLGKRPEDVMPLAEHFLKIVAQNYSLPVPELTPESKMTLQQYPWPGNVRELQRAIERAVVRASVANGKITPDMFQLPPVSAMAHINAGGIVDIRQLKIDIRSLFLNDNGVLNASGLAREINVNRNTLNRLFNPDDHDNHDHAAYALHRYLREHDETKAAAFLTMYDALSDALAQQQSAEKSNGAGSFVARSGASKTMSHAVRTARSG